MRIVCEVAEEYGISVADIRSDNRAQQYAWPRQIAMVRLRDETPLSYPAIARVLRRKDHTTIVYGERACRQRIKEGLI
jgi:chromosomal replication initiator protein